MKKAINMVLAPLVLQAILLFAGCSNFLSPVKAFLDEYTNTAAVAEVAFSRSVPQDGSGITCIPANETCTISFLLRNPQGYDLQPSAVLVSGTPLNLTDYTLALAADKQSVQLEFSQAFLAAHDMGGDISVTLALFEPATGRNFSPYTLQLKANTPPPVPQGGCILANASNHYVVCFNLDLGTIHGDLKSIEVNGYSTAVTSTVNTASLSFANPSFTASAGALGTLTPLGARPAFTAGSGTIVPVYLVTNEAVNAAVNSEYRITITDTAGFSTTYSLWTLSDFLGPVKITDLAGAEISGNPAIIAQDADKTTGTVLIKAPAVTDQGEPVSGVTVYYGLYFDEACNTLYYSGSFTGIEAAVDIPPVPVYIKAWAQKSGYTDSATKKMPVRATAVRLCVNEANIAGPYWGTNDYPYSSVATAAANLSALDNPENTIYVLSNITSELNLNTPGLILTIEGNNHEFDGGGSHRCFKLDAGDIKVKNVVFTNGQLTGGLGGGILVQNPDSKLTLDNCDIDNNVIDNSMHMGGAGISIGYGAKVTMSNCNVTNNRLVSPNGGAYGGGIQLITSGQNTELTMTLCTIEHNTASFTGSAPGYGGGIFISGDGASATLTNCIIRNNIAATQGSGDGGGIDIRTDATINIANCILQNNTSSEQSNGTGGGIALVGGVTAVLSDVAITGNIASLSGEEAHAGSGGGIYLENSTMTINNNPTNKISGNYAVKNYDADKLSASGYGGGICVTGASSMLTLTNCAIEDNTASTYCWGFGGGLAIDGNANVLVSILTVQANKATESVVNGRNGYGGGLYIKNSSLTVNAGGSLAVNENKASASIISNSAPGNGGGFYLENVTIINNGTINVSNNIAAETRSGNGGGIYINSGACEIRNFTITGNTALHDDVSGTSGMGGGIYINTTTDPGISILNTVISSNRAAINAPGEGGGIYINASVDLKFSSGLVSQNIASSFGSSQGNGIYAGTTFDMEGSASAAVDAYDNDVFLPKPSLITINVAATLSSEYGAVITPQALSNGWSLLSGDASSYDKFMLAPDFFILGWAIDGSGCLREP